MKKTNKYAYVLFGFKGYNTPDYEEGYVAFDRNDKLILVNSIDTAKKYDGAVKSGHGSPKDWAKMLNSMYEGLKVHPVKTVYKFEDIKKKA